MSEEFSLTLKGFKTKEQVKEFIDWRVRVSKMLVFGLNVHKAMVGSMFQVC